MYHCGACFVKFCVFVSWRPSHDEAETCTSVLFEMYIIWLSACCFQLSKPVTVLFARSSSKRSIWSQFKNIVVCKSYVNYMSLELDHITSEIWIIFKYLDFSAVETTFFNSTMIWSIRYLSLFRVTNITTWHSFQHIFMIDIALSIECRLEPIFCNHRDQ